MAASQNSSSMLMPLKFILLVIQAMLLIIIVMQEDRHIYFDIGQNFSKASSEYSAARIEQRALCYTYIGLCIFEFFMMIIGISVAPSFAIFNLLQILLHLLGCLFSLWYVLDSWMYLRMRTLFVFFSILPLILEFSIIQQASRLNKDIRLNTRQ